MSDEWRQTACILCSVNCGIEVKLDGRRIARVRGDKRASRVARLRLREGAAARPLPERPSPADDAAAPPRRRHVRGDRLGHRDPRGRRAARHACATPTAARASSITAAAGRGTTSAAATAARPAARSARLLVERAGAGEDRRVLGRRPALRPAALPHHRRLRARRGRDVRRQEPVAVARLPARARRPAEIADRPGALVDRDRSAAHARPPSSPTSTSRCVPAPTRSASPRCSACSSRRISSTRLPARAHRQRSRASCRRAPRRAADRRPLRASRASPRTSCARSRGASRRRRASRSSRTSASSRRRTAR